MADPKEGSSVDATTMITRGATVQDFWEWAYGSLAENAIRGVFAEYLVGLALEATEEPRVEWDAADLRYRDTLIEVKSSADNQTWEQTKPSTLRFDIAPKHWWNAATNETAREKERPADIYVFCHYTGQADAVQVVDTTQWAFYVCPTTVLDFELGAQRSAGINTIRRISSACSFTQLKSAVDDALDTRHRR